MTSDADFVRYVIREGDTTTAGGRVAPRESPGPRMDGVQMIFEGDPVHCPACSSIGHIECVPPRYNDTAMGGRQRSLDGDLCRCKCSPPPRLKALKRNYTHSFSKAVVARQAGVEGWLAYAGHGSALTQFDEFFVVHDRRTGKPFSDFAYALRTQLGVHHGHLHVDGATVKAYAEDEQQVDLLYLVQTRMGV